MWSIIMLVLGHLYRKRKRDRYIYNIHKYVACSKCLV